MYIAQYNSIYFTCPGVIPQEKFLKSLDVPKLSYRSKKGLINRSPYILKSLYGDDTWDKSFKFGIVRNPYQRIYTMYRIARNRQIGSLNKNFPTFNTWLSRQLNTTKINPMYSYFCDINGKIFLNQLLKIETFAQDVSILFENLSYNPIDTQAFAKLFTSNDIYKNVDIKIVYKQEHIEWIRDFFEKDFEIFDYQM